MSADANKPKCTPEQIAASEWSRNNWTEGMRIAGADSSYTAFHAFVAGAALFQPLLAKVEGERDALDRAVTLNRNNWRIDSEEKDAVITALRADLAAKEADTARLDWLARNPFRIFASKDGDQPTVYAVHHAKTGIKNRKMHTDFRAAIDDALASRADKGGATP